MSELPPPPSLPSPPGQAGSAPPPPQFAPVNSLPPGALAQYTASRFRGGRMLAPNSLVLYVDRVEELKPHALLKSGQAAIGFGQVAQVRVDKGLKWSDLVVESAGGHVVKVEGMQKADAETARAAITEAVAAWRQHQQAPTPATAALSVADELAKLAKLRDAGVLSEEEFAAQKSRLLT